MVVRCLAPAEVLEASFTQDLEDPVTLKRSGSSSCDHRLDGAGIALSGHRDVAKLMGGETPRTVPFHAAR